MWGVWVVRGAHFRWCIKCVVRHYKRHWCERERERERDMFYLTTHSTHFIYGYMASYIWLRTILIVRKETRCRHIGYSYRLTARVLLYARSHRQDNTYHGLCYTSRGALAGTRPLVRIPQIIKNFYLSQVRVQEWASWTVAQGPPQPGGFHICLVPF